MALVARLFVIAFASLAASLAAGLVVTLVVMHPEWSNLVLEGYEASFLGYVVTFGAIFVSVFALLPALAAIALAESLPIRSLLYYAAAGGAVAFLAYFSASGFDTLAFAVDGFARREMEVMVAAGIVAGTVYWAIAGRNAGRWNEGPAPS